MDVAIRPNMAAYGRFLAEEPVSRRHPHSNEITLRTVGILPHYFILADNLFLYLKIIRVLQKA